MKPAPRVYTHMKVDIGGAIEDGLRRTATQTGAILVGLFIAVGVAMGAAMNSLVVTLLTETFDLRPAFEESPEITYEQFVQQIQASSPLDVVDAPAAVLLGLVVVVWLAQTVVQIGAIRWYVEKRTGSLEVGLFTRRLLWTLGNLVVGFLLFAAVVFVAPLVVVGIAAAVNPLLGVAALLAALVAMVFLFVALFFYNYDIVVEGSNALDALVTSWELTAGNRVRLFALGLLVGIAGAVLGGLVSVITSVDPVVSTVVGQAVSAAVGVATLGIAAAAFVQLRGGADGEPEEVGALGPDDL